MAKNIIPDSILTCLTQIWAQIFFREFYLCQILGVVASYHLIQFQETRMIQTQENDKKYYFRPDLGPLGPNSGHQTFL